MQDFNTQDEFDYEQAINQAQEAAAHAAQQTPQRGSWGIESCGDGPAALGGGFGGFLWFASQEDLLEFVASQLVFADGVFEGRRHPRGRADDGRVARAFELGSKGLLPAALVGRFRRAALQ